MQWTPTNPKINLFYSPLLQVVQIQLWIGQSKPNLSVFEYTCSEEADKMISEKSTTKIFREINLGATSWLIM